MLSQTAEYALRAVFYLAEHGGADPQPTRADEIAGNLGIPANYLSKTLQSLVKQRVLHSVRGPRGGFRLARPPEQITLFDVIAPYGDLDADRKCLLGRPECSDRNPCPAHHAWKQTSDQLAAFFRTTTVADVQRTGVPETFGATPMRRSAR
jgi:Rrf2 family iron-sulfur cluster assembly transcriptional regulator